MDINEIDIDMRYRHPWEISRTKCLLWELRPLLKKLGDKAVFIDFGAGDQYFDDAVLERYPNYTAAAVDIGYTPETLKKIEKRVRNLSKIKTADSLSSLSINGADFALMMDSLEYLDDERASLKELASYVKPGGFIALSVPAYKLLFSEFDNIVKGKCRYNKKDIRQIIDDVPGLSIERLHCFYTLLFAVRFIQKYLRLSIDPEHKVIAGWSFSERSVVTKLLTGIMGIDYRVNAVLGKVGLDLPGLSILVICKKSK